MLQNSIICSKLYNLESNALITSKIGTHGKSIILKWFRRVFGRNQCITFQTIPFAANNATLQHIAATWLFFEKETLLNQFMRPSYPFVLTLEVTNALYSELNHLLQIMLFCSILQQPEFFGKKKPFWINSGCQTIPVYQF